MQGEIRLNAREKVIALTLILLSIVFLLSFINEPPSWDQANFFTAAESILEKGVPIYCPGYNLPPRFGLWHPPLYLYLLALSFRLFGVNVLAARLLGIVCYLLTMGLLYLLSRKILGHKFPPVLIFTFLLTATAPYIIQGTLLLDIDNTIMPLLLLIFIYYYIHCYQRNKFTFGNNLMLGFLLAVLFWSKFTTPLVLLPAILVFQIMNRNFKRAFYQLLMIGGTGMAVFLLSFWIYCYHFQMPFSMVFHRNIVASAMPRGLGYVGAFFHDILGRLGNFFFWLNPFYTALLAMNFFYWIRNKLVLNRKDPLNFIYLIAYLTFFGYLIIRMDVYYYPKYIFPAIVLFNFLISTMVVAKIPVELSFKKMRWPLVAVMLFTIFYLLFLGDVLLTFNNLKRILSPEQIPFIIGRISLILVIYLLPPLIIILILRKRINQTRLLLAMMLICLTAGNLSLNIAQMGTTYSKMYFYGEKGLGETIQFVKSIKESETIAIHSTGDIGWLAGRRFYFFDKRRPITLSEIAETYKPTYIILRDEFFISGMRSYNVVDAFMKVAANRKVIEEDYFLIKEYGFFSIYRRLNDR